MDWCHWLPIHIQINFKTATLTYNTLSSGHLSLTLSQRSFSCSRRYRWKTLELHRQKCFNSGIKHFTIYLCHIRAFTGRISADVWTGDDVTEPNPVDMDQRTERFANFVCITYNNQINITIRAFHFSDWQLHHNRHNINMQITGLTVWNMVQLECTGVDNTPARWLVLAWAT